MVVMRGSFHALSDEPLSRSARWGCRLGIFSVPVMAISLMVLRAGETDYRHATAVFLCASFMALLAFCLSLTALITIWIHGYRGTGAAIKGLLTSAAVITVPLWVIWQWQALPVLNDVSTDLGEPPDFVIAAADRRETDNPVSALDPGKALEQLASYPDVQPVYTPLPLHEAASLLLELVEERGWIVLAKPDPEAKTETQLEAVARAGILGTRTDVVLRLRQMEGLTRLDMRAASRQGTHDLGGNAELVAAFQTDFQSGSK
jgi:hypothetical protein